MSPQGNYPLGTTNVSQRFHINQFNGSSNISVNTKVVDQLTKYQHHNKVHKSFKKKKKKEKKKETTHHYFQPKEIIYKTTKIN